MSRVADVKPVSVGDEHIGFKKLEGELARRKGVSNPAALAAYIGEKKYGKAGMERRSEAARKHAHDVAPVKKTKTKAKTWPAGTRVSWHYRSAIGHGTITGVNKLGASHATTRYSIRETDHHPGEPSIVKHYGAALRKVS